MDWTPAQIRFRALERAGCSVTCATIPGWRCIKQKVAALAELVREKLVAIKGTCTVVLQLYDNSFFMAKTDDGGLIPAVRDGIGGKYHVHGESVFAPKELQYATFTLSKSILDAVSSQQKILVSPVPHYLHDGCCLDREHVSNLKEDGYQSSL